MSKFFDKAEKLYDKIPPTRRPFPAVVYGKRLQVFATQAEALLYFLRIPASTPAFLYTPLPDRQAVQVTRRVNERETVTAFLHPCIL